MGFIDRRTTLLALAAVVAALGCKKGDHAAASAGSYRFAVKPIAVSRRRLDRVAEGVAEIEQSAFARFSFVGHDDFHLDPATLVNGVQQRLRLARQQRCDVGFKPRKELGVANGAAFDHLRETRRKFAVRQRAQAIRIDQDGARLVECADHVLSERMVDAGLAAY